MNFLKSAICVLLWCVAAPSGSAQSPAASEQTKQVPATAEKSKPAPFESEVTAFETADKKSPPPKGAVLFIGSSSIRLWTTLAKDFPELTVINRGFGGSQIEDSTRYASRIIIPYRPRMIVLYAGGNDINGGKSPAQVSGDFDTFVKEIHAALPETRIVYISMNPAVSRWSKEAKFVETNRMIERYIQDAGKAFRLSFIDSHSKLLSDKGEARPEILRADGLHLNSKGYALWIKILRPSILELAGPEPTR